MPIKESRLSPSGSDGLGIMRTAVAHYDFAVHGGAVSTITLGTNPTNTAQAQAVTLPNNAVIVDAMTDVITALAGAGASVAFGANTTVDLLAATAIGTSGTVGRHDLIPVGTAATSVKTTAARNVTMTISGGVLTAGKLTVMIRYFVSA